MTLDALLRKDIANGRIFAIEAKTEKKGLKGIRYTKHTTLTAQWGVNLCECIGGARGHSRARRHSTDLVRAYRI